MSDDHFDDGAYEVGYKKPPKHSQFKPGTSGNPKGRRKARPTFDAILEKQLYKLTSVKVGSEVRHVAVIEAAVMRLSHILLQGPPAQVVGVWKLIVDQLPNEKPELFSELSDEEVERRIQLHLKRRN